MPKPKKRKLENFSLDEEENEENEEIEEDGDYIDGEEEEEEEDDIDIETDEENILGNKKVDEKTLSHLLEVKQEIKRTEPNIVDILNSNILIADKAELLQLFELYKLTPFSEESISLKRKIYE